MSGEVGYCLGVKFLVTWSTKYIVYPTIKNLDSFAENYGLYFIASFVVTSSVSAAYVGVDSIAWEYNKYVIKNR